MTLVRRGHKYHFDSVIGGTRYRCSLGTSDSKAASRLENRIQFALADGPRSPVWSELKSALPVASFERLTDGVLPQEPMSLTAYEQRFLDHISLRVRLGEISEGTKLNYDRVTKTFFDWALGRGVKRIDEITANAVSEYCLWRKESIVAKGGSGRGMITETTVLSMLFDFAIEEGWLVKTPLKYKPKPATEAEAVHPFTEEEVRKMDELVKTPLEEAVLAVFKHTGLRCADVADLRWSAFDFKTCTLTWRTAKRGTVVEIPIGQGFRSSVCSWRMEDEPRVFPGMIPSKLYRIVRQIGERAGVENCHPHRWRHTFCCRILAKGGSLFDAASLLGDSHQVVAKYYSKFTSGQADRVRKLLEEPESVLV